MKKIKQSTLRFSVSRRTFAARLSEAFLLLASIGVAQSEPLKIGYSDWPGWVAWEIAIKKDWFKEEGVDVKFEWYDYVESMDAYAA